MSERPHTVGEIITSVITICEPADPHDAHLGRSYDGMRIALSSRTMDELRSSPLTPASLAMIRDIVSRYRSRIELNVPDALAFLETARVAVPEPGAIARYAGAIGNGMRGLVERVMRKRAADNDTPATEPSSVNSDAEVSGRRTPELSGLEQALETT